MNASIAQQILRSTPDEYEAEKALEAEIRAAEENGFSPDPEVVDALDAIHQDWDEQQKSEIDAEMAIERYYEGGWDKTGEYSRELYDF